MANSKIKFLNGNGIPSIGYGTWLMQDPEVLETALEAALETGYRHIDTAFFYGNETVIGNVLKRWFDKGKLTREELFVTTKLPMHGMNPLKVLHFLQLSLNKLQLSYADLYLIHMPYGFNYIDDDATLPFKDEEQLQRIVDAAKIPPANLQVEMNVYFQQRELRALCKKLGVTLTAYAPLGSPGRAALHSAFQAPFADVGLLVDPVVKGIALKQNKTPAQILVRYLLDQNVVVLCKSDNPERVKENFNVFDFELSPEDATRLDQLDKGAQGRSFVWTFLPGITEHPEFPFNAEISGESEKTS
ncbi:unnamed protein product [Allacma fusca]|uniref:NADP-dependent oxidoreductase domain-containing protein n=1 Tax=Allacma fusca TaxID=39272 RepID=A0A8J2KRI5_9HEXA|nr:unnamed protein product [Allacma fusca]